MPPKGDTTRRRFYAPQSRPTALGDHSAPPPLTAAGQPSAAPAPARAVVVDVVDVVTEVVVVEVVVVEAVVVELAVVVLVDEVVVFPVVVVELDDVGLVVVLLLVVVVVTTGSFGNRIGGRGPTWLGALAA